MTAPLQVPGPFPDTLKELQRLARLGTPALLTGLDGLAPLDAETLLAWFLHDPAATSPVEPFATLLSAMLHKRELSLWALFSQEPDAFLKNLPAEHSECLACPCFPICLGYGAWAGSCATWLTLLTGLARAARDLSRLKNQGPRSFHDLTQTP